MTCTTCSCATSCADPTPGPKPDPKPDANARVILELPVEDLKKNKGGVWNLAGRVNWKKSAVVQFQGRPAIRCVYPKGSGTSAHGTNGGFSFSAVPKPLPSDEAVLSFDVWFDPGWNFSKGGKFGGFLVGYGNASGYQHSTTGASHRIMWKRNGGAITYIYPPSGLKQADPKLKAQGHGVGYFEKVFPEGTLKIGAWNSVQIGVKNNTFTGSKPNPDGVAYLKVNGTQTSVGNIRWCRTKGTKVSSVIWNTFFGGPDPAVVDCVAYYRDFKLIGWPSA